MQLTEVVKYSVKRPKIRYDLSLGFDMYFELLKPRFFLSRILAGSDFQLYRPDDNVFDDQKNYHVFGEIEDEYGLVEGLNFELITLDLREIDGYINYYKLKSLDNSCPRYWNVSYVDDTYKFKINGGDRWTHLHSITELECASRFTETHILGFTFTPRKMKYIRFKFLDVKGDVVIDDVNVGSTCNGPVFFELFFGLI